MKNLTSRGSCSQKEALAYASKFVSVEFHNSQWHVYKPWKCTNPTGPSGEPYRTYSKRQAYLIRANYVACIALHKIQFEGEEYAIANDIIDYKVWNDYPENYNARGLLKIGLQSIAKYRLDQIKPPE